MLKPLCMQNFNFPPKMPRGKELTKDQKTKIETLAEENRSIRYIAKKVEKSKSIVSKYIRSPKTYGITKRRGRLPKLSNRMKRSIVSQASNKIISCNQIRAELPNPVSKMTVWRVLNASPILNFEKIKTKPILTPDDKIKRLEFAKKTMTYNAEWKSIVFSDEKKFNLDGPDGCHSYWHDLRKEKIIMSKRQQGGGSVMVWGGFSNDGKTAICFINVTMNSTNYQTVLQRNLLTYMDKFPEKNLTFQQDNAPCHRSMSTMEWIEEKGLDLLPWPAHSPDLNPIENLWGLLARKVYAGGRQFSTVQALKDQIVKSWDEIELKDLQKLISSMPNRIYEVILNQGSWTKY